MIGLSCVATGAFMHTPEEHPDFVGYRCQNDPWNAAWLPAPDPERLTSWLHRGYEDSYMPIKEIFNAFPAALQTRIQTIPPERAWEIHDIIMDEVNLRLLWTTLTKTMGGSYHTPVYPDDPDKTPTQQEYYGPHCYAVFLPKKAVLGEWIDDNVSGEGRLYLFDANIALPQVIPVQSSRHYIWGNPKENPQWNPPFHFLDEESPLEYRKWYNVERLSVVDPNAGPAPKGDTYFAPTERKNWYGKTGRRLKRPKIEKTPGASENVVGFIDYNINRQNNGIEFAYTKIRKDFRGVYAINILSLLIDELYKRYADAPYIYWGKIMHPAIWKLYQRQRKLADRGLVPHTSGGKSF
jgi:hypothetical protein